MSCLEDDQIVIDEEVEWEYLQQKNKNFKMLSMNIVNKASSDHESIQ